MEPLRAYRTEDILNNYVKWIGPQGDQALDWRTLMVPEQDTGDTILDCEDLPPDSSGSTESSEEESDIYTASQDKLEDQTIEPERPDTPCEENDSSSVYSEEEESLQTSNEDECDDIDNSSKDPDIADKEESSEAIVSHTPNAGATEYYRYDDWDVSPKEPVESDKLIHAKLLGVFKHEWHKALTISDDQSAGSKIEQRNLLVLEDRTNNVVQFRSGSYINSSDYALQDYQMQLMLLEQQNKRRLLIARQEQDNLHFDGQYLTQLTGIPQSTSSTVNQPKAMSEVQHTSSGAGTGQPAPTNTISTINKANGIDGNLIEASLQGAIGTADTSKLDLQKLQEYIEFLQAKALRFEAIQKEQAPSRYQVLYRLMQPELNSRKDRNTQELRLSLPFFDHPEWVEGQGNMRYVHCKLPLSNFDLYLEKNKDISFIVYRNFDPTLDSILTKPGTNESGVQGDHLPNFTSETIRLVAEYLVNVIKTLLESREEYASMLREYNTSYELSAPYLFMYHSRKKLDDIQTGLSEPARKQLSIFSDYISERYGHIYAAADSLLSQDSISSDHIQYLFKPGDVLVARKDGQYTAHVATSWPIAPRTITVSNTHAKSLGNGIRADFYGSKDTPGKMQGDKVKFHRYRVGTWHWAFDGNFQQKHESLQLDIPFDKDESTTASGVDHSGTTGDRVNDKIVLPRQNIISELNMFPIQYASDEIVARLRRRGRTFWNCRKRRFVSYRENDKDDIHNLAEERYMVDLKTWRSLHPENFYSSKPLVDELGPEAMERDNPPDEQFELLLPLEIKGYNLRRKKWFDLVADRIYDVKWNREAFQTLVIDRKARDLIQALVSNQLATEKSTDLIAGKGNGLIMLLHGGPGTGKTLTAESVAEIAEKPLYRVTCGDVGTKVEDVERYLDSVLHLGKIWGCVVLLDEADVFLEQRSLEDLERNALVSVFLRVLEYYEGILVLTSNRVGTFDEAFKSRIQLALHYPNLGPYQRLRIWETFIHRLESFGDDAVDIADLRDHLEDLKEEKMNGRQIRNAITTARQYAQWKKSILNYEHLKDVIEVSGRFDKYLDRLNDGLTQDELAQDEGLRLA